jgi:hypothetical protein
MLIRKTVIKKMRKPRGWYYFLYNPQGSIAANGKRQTANGKRQTANGKRNIRDVINFVKYFLKKIALSLKTFQLSSGGYAPRLYGIRSIISFYYTS